MDVDQQIDDYLKQPIKVGDKVNFTGEGNGSQDPTKKAIGTVKSIDGGQLTLSVRSSYNEVIRDITEVTKDVSTIGHNPFSRQIQYTQYNIDLSNLCHHLGFDTYDYKWVESYGRPRCNFNPTVNGIPYQRDYVWTLEQDQALLNSIFNYGDIGRFVVRKRSFEDVDSGTAIALRDLVDGKQRSSAIIRYICNEYPDSNGYYFCDLSERAQGEFLRFNQLTYVELPENTSDSDTLRMFLSVNDTGVPMSRDHLNRVYDLYNSL